MTLKIVLVGAGSREFGPATIRDILLSDALCAEDLAMSTELSKTIRFSLKNVGYLCTGKPWTGLGLLVLAVAGGYGTLKLARVGFSESDAAGE